ncbi:AbrB/MazE/SpoVT family DNA-binding domain-containing protein (plasmid) [Roseobacter denitrificans]|uniref:Virulence associated protein, putative n=1 Tax=Roseobacter denitrificans (strain ATCC 33942 / OCh 114) TaxID=375451 RepID=Q07GS2_ROSDO|nr:AbrB/MazE/SpoVT family DNA-binding domain-containing protein [Roseobacter denitrificans]ABI93327.1 virulence associated protein, putative [Roseobacter denitrificans OCh 114]AVL51208.1 AbrB/MazE/SpoVT family DNA-binding domain-containing protein [Roseobacter denitrificans]SFG40783.1 antitoxin VapB [Roseobacter denitrificans OCh 114]
MTAIAKLFTNGRSQAVRIPKDFAFHGIDEVSVRKIGNKLVLEPIRKTWTSLADEEPAAADFMAERPDLLNPDRVKF